MHLEKTLRKRSKRIKAAKMKERVIETEKLYH